MEDFLRFVVLGAGTGALYGLVALAVVLAFRASGVLNFAAGATGAGAAFVFYDLRDQHGWNWPLAFVLCLALGATIGACTQIAVMVILRRASTLSKAIATLGLLSAMQGVITLIWGVTPLGQPQSILPVTRVTMGSIAVTEDRLIIIGLAVLLAIVLRLVYSRTLFGLATSAVAENPRVAAIRGWSPSRIELANFMLAGALSALAAILLAPIVGLNVSALAIGLLLPALASALVGRFESFALSVGAALLIGVSQAELERYTTEITDFIHVKFVGLGATVPLLVVVIIIVAGGRGRAGRGDESARLPLPGGGQISPVLLVVGTTITAVLMFALDASWTDAITTSLIWGIMILSVVLVTGFAGQLSMSQFALGGFGAWVAARLFASQGWPFEVVVLLGLAATIPVGLIVALPALRTRGVNLAVVTLALSLMTEALIFNNSALTGGYSGTTVADPTLLGIDIDPIRHPNRYGLLVLVAFLGCGLVVANIRRGSVGRRLLAVRGNERAAAALGISVYGAKIYAFSASGLIAGMAGVLFAFQRNTVLFAQFNVFASIQAIEFAVIGGIAWASGAIIGCLTVVGGVLPKLIDSFFDINTWLIAISGAAVIVTILQAPEGLASLQARIFGPVTRRLPRLEAKSGSARRREPRPKVDFSLRGVSMHFGGVPALVDVGLDVGPGEIVGLIGPNGAGKTTLLDVATGFTRPSTGQILLGGRDVTGWSPERLARAGLGRSFQAVELFGEMTVRENLLVACDDRDAWRYVTDIFHPGRAHPTELMKEVVDEFQLGAVLDARPSELPQGQGRLVGIARSILTEPSVLFLDEPGAGLDPTERSELGEEIRRMARERGIAIVLVEHDMEMVMRTCDRIVVLDFGRKIAEGTVDEVSSNPRVVAAYLGEPDGSSDQPNGDDAVPATPAEEPHRAR